jgi:hypothetical protein
MICGGHHRVDPGVSPVTGFKRQALGRARHQRLLPGGTPVRTGKQVRPRTGMTPYHPP